MNVQKSLEELGLHKNESTVYLELLPLGMVTAGPLVRRTKLHRQIVYQSLERLKEIGLVTVMLKQRRQHFQACSPRNLTAFVERKREVADKLLPILLALQAKANDRLEVRVLNGQKGFFDNLQDIITSAARTDKIIRIIGGAKDTDFYQALGDLYNDYLQLLKKHNVKKQLIAPEHFSREFKEKFAHEKGSALRTLASGLSAPTYTRITAEMLSIEIYGEEPTVIQIYNKATARGYLEHFNLLWDQSRLYTTTKKSR